MNDELIMINSFYYAFDVILIRIVTNVNKCIRCHVADSFIAL